MGGGVGLRLPPPPPRGSPKFGSQTPPQGFLSPLGTHCPSPPCCPNVRPPRPEEFFSTGGWSECPPGVRDCGPRSERDGPYHSPPPPPGSLEVDSQTPPQGILSPWGVHRSSPSWCPWDLLSPGLNGSFFAVGDWSTPCSGLHLQLQGFFWGVPPLPLHRLLSCRHCLQSGTAVGFAPAGGGELGPTPPLPPPSAGGSRPQLYSPRPLLAVVCSYLSRPDVCG